jgi:hypothetical protein
MGYGRQAGHDLPKADLKVGLYVSWCDAAGGVKHG